MVDRPADWLGAAYDDDPDETPGQEPHLHRFATEAMLVEWVAEDPVRRRYRGEQLRLFAERVTT